MSHPNGHLPIPSLTRLATPHVAEVARTWTETIQTRSGSGYERGGSRKLWRVRLLAVACILLAGRASAAEVTTKTSTESVQVAEPFALEISVIASPDAKVTFPSVAEKLGEFDIRGSQDVFDVPTPDASGRRVWMRRMTLESIATGKLTIPPIEIRVNENGNDTLVQSRPIAVRVASVLEDRSDPTEFRDIQPVVDVDVPVVSSNEWVGWTIGGVAVLTLCAIVGLVLSRRGRWLTPNAWAMTEFDELEASIDANAIDSEIAAQRLSDIVLSYLLLQFGIADAGRTPHELLNELAFSKRVAVAQSDQLESLFTLADKAKFAGLQLSTMGLKSAIADSRELVQRIADEFESGRSRQTLHDAEKEGPIHGEISYGKDSTSGEFGDEKTKDNN
ncbi:hypothetical protein Q31b_32680 [Novipirellula aureliae]|uniref:Protein BatD n=1 Tax=Novipirellula aureliae TaxID=2527966 RepID=A0A5C6DTE5_9BACT|nr:protein BatD [Novipirellula aureliae]TWU39952.1 hypothetical protein Q31b_32680 [Novipirellula aureliae]